ncbi:hypothetical protein TpMuguga_03g00417 [Theileria parva strain Muguga]|uniref:Uncharacterized protein n=1 Tax=Theileria parva TaxID=5875 RepID=Q4MZU3_THEPA|nr:uncharacterized protein TpMuguga_03g00417 [Theileria parva strain Muguga]EAN31154.1 hypothetical protein TpMuguga_03g00417 [Theileria parva strain Muguga]|eukprot:XP_763437.1 hypothetical protein [Theileria parva strain Muguga]
MSFFNEPYDVQLVLGLTLVGVPNSWDDVTLVGYMKSYSYAFGSNEVSIMSVFIENTVSSERKAHITCNNLYSKQKLLKIRLIPVICGEESKYCQIITVRPYCFWMSFKPDSYPVPYMLPKYGSQDLSYEVVEAKMLLHKNNIHPSIVTCLMEFNLLPKGFNLDGGYWCASDAIAIWLSLKDENVTLFNFLEEMLSKIKMTASTFQPYSYELDDESVYSSRWDQLVIQYNNDLLWPWDDINPQKKLNITHKGRRRNKKIGCIRYESSRKRWVVDLSLDGRRLQKCFHESYYGLVGGLAEALKWRLEYLVNNNRVPTPESELKSTSDLFDKILQINVDGSQKLLLIEVLKRPIEGFEQYRPNEQIEQLIAEKIQQINNSNNLSN